MLELERKLQVRSIQLLGQRKMKPREVKWLHEATQAGRGRLSPAPVVWPPQLAPSHTCLHTPAFGWFCFRPTRNPQQRTPAVVGASLLILTLGRSFLGLAHTIAPRNLSCSAPLPRRKKHKQVVLCLRTRVYAPCLSGEKVNQAWPWSGLVLQNAPSPPSPPQGPRWKEGAGAWQRPHTDQSCRTKMPSSAGPGRASQSLCSEWGQPRAEQGASSLGAVCAWRGGRERLGAWPQNPHPALVSGVEQATVPGGTPHGDCACSTQTLGGCRTGWLQEESLRREETEAMSVGKRARVFVVPR